MIEIEVKPGDRIILNVSGKKMTEDICISAKPLGKITIPAPAFDDGYELVIEPPSGCAGISTVKIEPTTSV